MKRRTTLFTLAMLLSAGFGMQAQNLSRQPLSSITLQHDPLLPQAASENTDKTGWLWKKRVHKVFHNGEWIIANKRERTFDENDHITTETLTLTHGYGQEEFSHWVFRFDSNGFCNQEKAFHSYDGVNFRPITMEDREADPIFTQTLTSNRTKVWNTETNLWEEDDIGRMASWLEVKRYNEGRITEVVTHNGFKPYSISSQVCYQYHYKDGERAPHEIVLFPNNDNIILKNIKWHESDGNFIWLSNILYNLFFDYSHDDFNPSDYYADYEYIDYYGNYQFDYYYNYPSKNNKPISYEAYDKAGNLLGINQYTYQADGSYEKKTEINNATLLLKHTVLDQYGSYERTINLIENQKYTQTFIRELCNEQGHRKTYECYVHQDKDESTGDFEIILTRNYTNTYENGVLTAIDIERYDNEEINIEPIRIEFSDFHKPQTGIDNQTAANDLNVVFINNCLQLNLPVGTSYILCDIQGRVITSGNEAPEQLDLNSYTNGVYLFKVKTKDGRQQCFKLMKH